MALKDVHDKLDEIPEPFRELYTEKNGKFELTGITGVKTSADVARLNESLKKEREEHKATKNALSVWGDLKHDEVVEKLERYPELEAASKGKFDEAKLDALANERAERIAKSKLTPVERENARLKQEREALLGENTSLKGEAKQRKVHDALRSALAAAKVLPEAHEDALVLSDRLFEVTEDGKVVTRDNVGVTPGLDPKAWLIEIQAKKPHWWPANVGGGAKGGNAGGIVGGKNPWSAEHWNLTEQGNYMRAHGREKAEQLAKQAGTTVGAPRPVPKLQTR